MLSTPSNCWRPYRRIFVFSLFSLEKTWHKLRSVLNMAGSNSQIDKPQYGRPKRAELLYVNINSGAQIINIKRASLMLTGSNQFLTQWCIFGAKF